VCLPVSNSWNAANTVAGGAAACETTTGIDPPDHEIVIVPLRAPPLFAATLNARVAESLPDVAPVSVRNALLDAALHEQLPDVRVTSRLNGPPACATLKAFGDAA